MSDSERGLSDAWRRWVAEALAGGAVPRDVAAVLIAEGVPEPIAVREVGIIDAACAGLAARLRRFELVLELLQTHAPGYIARRLLCGAEESYDR